MLLAKPEDYNHEQVSMNYAPFWGLVAYYFWPLGFPSCYCREYTKNINSGFGAVVYSELHCQDLCVATPAQEPFSTPC